MQIDHVIVTEEAVRPGALRNVLRILLYIFPCGDVLHITIRVAAAASNGFVFLPDLMNEEWLEQVSRNAEHDLRLIQERYAWFLTEMYKDAPPEKKKGQKKEALALRIYKQCIDAFVSGISLGADTEVDTPQLNGNMRLSALTTSMRSLWKRCTLTVLRILSMWS